MFSPNPGQAIGWKFIEKKKYKENLEKLGSEIGKRKKKDFYDGQLPLKEPFFI